MLRGTLATGICWWYSQVAERVRLHKELKVLYRQDKAEPPRQQSYSSGLRIAGIPADHN
jgi:hypothetical protein